MADVKQKKKAGRKKVTRKHLPDSTWFEKDYTTQLGHFLERFREHFGVERADLYHILGWSKGRYHRHLDINGKFCISKYPALLDFMGIPFSRGMAFLYDYCGRYRRRWEGRLLIKKGELEVDDFNCDKAKE